MIFSGNSHAECATAAVIKHIGRTLAVASHAAVLQYLAEMATPDEIAVVVNAGDFLAARLDPVPSVSQAEMAHYAQIRERFSRSMNASNPDEDSEVDDQEIDTSTKDKGKSKDDSTSNV